MSCLPPVLQETFYLIDQQYGPFRFRLPETPGDILFRFAYPHGDQVRPAFDQQGNFQLFRQPAPVSGLTRSRRPVQAQASGFCLFQACGDAFNIGVRMDERGVVGFRQPVRVIALYALVPLGFEGVVDDQFQGGGLVRPCQFIPDGRHYGGRPGDNCRRQGFQRGDALDIPFAEQVRAACAQDFLPLSPGRHR